MSIITISEGTTLALSGWAARIGVREADLGHLFEAKILRPTESGRFVLSFVGVVIFTDCLLFAQPKFGDASPLDLSDTLHILRSYFARSHVRHPLADRHRDPEFGDDEILREFDALVGLRDWFSAYGLYRREQAQVSDRGRPHWVRTIARRSALIMQGAAIYPSVISERREGVLNDISALQSGVLRQLLQRYGLPVPDAIRHADLATGMAIPSWPMEPDARKYYERRLANEQRSVYRTDTLHLFKLLREVLDSRLASPSIQPQVYGTTAFYAVWEDACRTGVGSDITPESVATLGQPTWWTQDDVGTKTRHSQAQIPDLLVMRDPWLLILDAKYYYPFPEARPGGPDIVKQIYYAESLQHLPANVLSVFLLPLPGAVMPRFLGYATIEGARQPFGNVEAWGLDPAFVLSAYPSVSASRANGVIEAILNQRGRVAEFIDQVPAGVGG